MKKYVFLDANVLFSAAWRPKAGLQALWKRRDFTLCSSSYALDEAKRNLDNDQQRKRLAKLVKKVSLSDPLPADQLPPEAKALPVKDQPILLAAMAAGADVLVTGDQAHFGRWYGKMLGPLKVSRPADVLRDE